MANRERYFFRKVVPLTCAVVCLGVVAAAIAMEEWHNFRVVSPGRCYRSGYMDRDELLRYERKYGLRTVVNLRGANPEEGWYIKETDVCLELGIVFHDFPLTSTAEPTDAQIVSLIDLFKESEEPILIHCHSGIDRAGLASAIWLIVMEDAEKDLARKQLSWRYGYFPIFGADAMQEFIDRWEPAPSTP